MMDEWGVTEIETPLLSPYFGGASARPFVTRVNALDGQEMYLAVSPEPDLKRAIVGGFEEGVYVITRNFRNEGIDASHNPEFIALEMYLPYMDYEDMMGFVERIVSRCCTALHGGPCCEYGRVQIEFSPPWPRVPVVDAVNDATGLRVQTVDGPALADFCKTRGLDEGFPIDEASAKELAARCERARLPALQRLEKPRQGGNCGGDQAAALPRGHRNPARVGRSRSCPFERYVEPGLIQPCHVMLHPARSTVLCKKWRRGPLPNGYELVERFESHICGMELSNAYSELNDPVLQRRLVEEQVESRARGDEEAMPHNELFLLRSNLACPPCGGLGIGLDRSVAAHQPAVDPRRDCVPAGKERSFGSVLRTGPVAGPPKWRETWAWS